MIGSLQARLLVLVGVLAIAAVAAAAFAARQSTRHEFRRFQELVKVSETTSRPFGSAEKVSAALDGRCCTEESLRAAEQLLRPEHGFLVLEAKSYALVAIGGKARQVLQDAQVRADGGRLVLEATRERHGINDGVKLMFPEYGGSHIALADGRPATVRVLPLPTPDEPDEPAAAFLGSVDRRLVIATSAIGVLALLSTWGITRRIVGPVRELRNAARDLARGDLSRRVTSVGADEIAELAGAFNAMAADLERQQMLRRNLVDNVAHELRTPLTSLRCQLETMIDGLAADPQQALRGANDEVAHLTRLVEDLQELALAEAGELRLAIVDVEVADVVRSAVRAAGLDGDPRLCLELDGAVRVRADAIRLRQALLNLLTNAERHTPGDGVISVRVARQHREAIFAVHNTGSALADEQLARVFDRFWRGDPARQRRTGGSGLGLAIVKHLVEAQGGRVWGERQAEGMSFGFTLPAA